MFVRRLVFEQIIMLPWSGMEELSLPCYAVFRQC